MLENLNLIHFGGKVMSIQNKAEDLAREIVQSKEYKDYIKAKEMIEKDQSNILLLESFRRKQWEIQMAQLLGQEVDEEQLLQLDQIYQLLSANSVINEYLMAEYRLSRVLGDVQKILTQWVDSNWVVFRDYSSFLN